MGLTRKFISIITILIYSIAYASGDVGNNFCFNYGRTDEYGCISDTYADNVQCTLTASMVGPALTNITNVHIKMLYICIDNKFAKRFPSHAGKQVDIKPLERFPGVLKLAITTFNRVSSYLFHLDYNRTTFQHMNQIELFQLNVPIQDDLTGIFDHMTSLKVLDLSYTLETGLGNSLTWISKLPSRGLTEIKLQKVQIIGYNHYTMSLNFTNLFRNVTFENVRILDIRNNDLSTVYAGIDSAFPNIENIDGSFNQLQGGSSLPLFIELLMSPKLQKWDISNQHCLEQISKYVPTFQDSDFSRNKTDITSTEDAGFIFWGKHLPINCINYASKGNVSRVFNSSELTCRLFNCIISQYVKRIPCSVFPALSEIININDVCLFNINLPFFKNIKIFNMSNTNWFDPNGYSFAGHNLCFGNNSLREFNYAYNSKMAYALQVNEALENTTFIGLNHLESLNLSGNALNLDISRFCTNKQSFANSLKQFDLSHNFLNVSADFQPCNTCARDLTHIDLSNNGLSEIPTGIFSACSSLVSASLKNNRFNSNGTFINLTDTTNLRELDLSENSIETLNPEFRMELENLAFLNKNQSQKMILNLQSNPILCSCNEDVVEFIHWMQTTSVQFKNKDSYTCTGIDGIQQITTINFHQYKSKCFPSNFVTIFSTMMSTSGFMFMVCLICLGYYKRFTAKYYIFRVRQLFQCSKHVSPVIANRRYKYDVFVSYIAEDRFWVHEVLMKQLENVYKFKLCIHYRDFPAGGSISEVILRKLNESREIIFVLSDYFIATLTIPERLWLQFELDEACDLVRVRRKNIIVIKLGNITRPVNDRNVAYLLEGGNIFLEWPENPKGHKVFWAKLVSDLYGDTQGCLSCCFNTRGGIGHRDVTAFSRVDSSDEDIDDSIIIP